MHLYSSSTHHHKKKKKKDDEDEDGYPPSSSYDSHPRTYRTLSRGSNPLSNRWYCPILHIATGILLLSSCIPAYEIIPPSSNAMGGNNHGNEASIVPILGPIPNIDPLLVGSDLILPDPTPLQWKALHAASVLPLSQVVSAAPIVALLDKESSSIQSMCLPNGKVVKGRYATLAAVMGVKRRSYGGVVDDDCVEDCRLLGIGRCVITSFKNRVVEYDFLEHEEDKDDDPSSSDSSSNRNIEDGSSDECVINNGVVADELLDSSNTEGSTGAMDARDDGDNEEDGCSSTMGVIESATEVSKQDIGDWKSLSSSTSYESDSYEDDDDEDHGLIIGKTPIVVGEFLVLGDFATGREGSEGDRHVISPVHAINALNSISLKVQRLHEQRRRIVAGLKAAKARLAESAKRKQEALTMDFVTDEDLFRSISSFFEEDSGDDETTVVKTIPQVDQQVSCESDENDDIPSDEDFLGTEVDENFGLDLVSSFSTIQDLTSEVIEKLRPFYSEEHQEQESYNPEILSFVAWSTVSKLVDKSELAWALRSASTVERLDRVYEIMMDHKLQLNSHVDTLKARLEENGEECADLW
eukprot:CAMPEP_0116067558 /NCGR_PEP_ID=MMETSP0322-20121206/11110_1 /TAXON_ID=163516 /ORGANISM="Leptocylindrus danicus var. apora, Strain B651" /LENGTH=581 /DNA_ID=CAMNT_0003554447 /DNA_START=392 /DNA_END=2137 /DNA_ORIENTATION=+